MRIISLDFDGVLHPSPHHHPRAEVATLAWIDHLVPLLEGHPDVGLLVHSSWREVHSLDDLQDMLYPMEARFAGATPPGERQASLTEWRDAHLNPPLLVIDDDPDVEAPAGSSLVRCNPRTGLAARDVQDAISAWLEATK